ncbi:hypothetical protein [Paenibacillus sp. FSL K6-0108]|uniref:hypothetical protein n=1 Tax=Paenibacillus sp. FSL K6-0108 TaxID=2921417 RepID=UPI00324E2986
MNTRKSKILSVVAQKHFKFLGFTLGKNGNGVYIQRTPPSSGQGKEEAEGTDEPKSRQKCTTSDGEREGLHSWLDRLFLRSGHETNLAKLE